ncbi:MAG: class III extradiol ring-cleavage dioxygenase, partial [Cypionkella sp.]
MARLPTYFISHGGGPWPWIANMRQQLATLETALARMPQEIGETPKAVLMISGHWETPDFAVMSSPNPGMVYDYGGFPPETYQIKYPSPGAPDGLAGRTADLIKAAGLPTHLDAKQGYDHGTFVPAYVMYPKADVPLYQVSLQHGYNPEAHFALGRALAPLRDEGVLIVGSGLSYHNLRLFGPGAKVPSAAFDAWLADVMKMAPDARTAALLDWESAPYARV